MRMLLRVALPMLLCFICQERSIAMPSDTFLTAEEILPLVVHHSLGWGVTGMDTAVHAPGVEPLPLQIGDTVYPAGLGLHAPCDTWLDLGGRYDRFEAVAGVQRQEHPEGSVVFRVYADEELAFDSGVLTQTDPPAVISLPVTGVQYLRLEITDAGDGLTCDGGNWVNMRLTPASGQVAGQARTPEVDLAPFARVLTWNPWVKDGTHTMRTEEFPVRDLFPGTEVQPDADGLFPIPALNHPHASIGAGCIGLEWLEPRRIRRVAVVFEGEAPSAEGVAFEHWQMTPSFDSTPGVSRWQGHWERVVTPVERDGDTWSIALPDAARGWERVRTMKVRFIVPLDAAKQRVRHLTAHTDSAWKEAEVTLAAAAGGTATVSMYNGEAPGRDNSFQWDMAQPLALRVRYADPKPWTRSDQTVIRLATPGGAFGIRVMDIVDKGAVEVRHAGVTASVAGDAPAAAASALPDILAEVREMPDQTFAQAIETMHRNEGDLGPTLLSLANGNAKFVHERPFDLIWPADYRQFKHAVRPRWKGHEDAPVTRHLDGGWMPIPVVTQTADGVTVTQRTFVAPVGKKTAGDTASWWHDKPLCVAEVTVRNAGEAAQPFAMNLACTADIPSGAAATLRAVDRGVAIDGPGGLLALLDTTAAAPLVTRLENGVLVIEGALAAGAEASYTLLIPGWEAAAEALPAVAEVPALLVATKAHWEDAMAGSIAVSTPDPWYDNLLKASRVHCMLAARNQDGKRVAPWIGSVDYGPFESEAHSIVRGMAFLGHEDFARRGLDFFINRYNDRGYLSTGYTVIGTGWHLWALGEFFALSRDEAWLRENAPEIKRVCRWILAQREKTMQPDPQGRPRPEHGLMPPGVLADWGVYSHYFYLNGNYHAGLLWAGQALESIGDPEAGVILAKAGEFREDILRAFRDVQAMAPVVPLRDGSWVPYYPTQLYSPMPIEDMYWSDDAGRSWCYDVELGAHHLVPMGVLDAQDPATDWMMGHMEDVQFLRSGWFYYEEEGNHADWFNRGGFAKVQPFYARTAEVHAMRDDVKPFLRSYINATVSLLNREDLSLWEHFMNGAYNKTHETGYFLHQSRLLFVMERGDDLWLAPFVPNYWLRDGAVEVKDAPTLFGNAGYRIEPDIANGVIRAEITPLSGESLGDIVLRLRHPDGKKMQQADVKGGTLVSIDAEREIVRIKPGGKAISVIAQY
jgi:hypothetical protein